MSKKTQKIKQSEVVAVSPEPAVVDWVAIAALEKQALEAARKIEPIVSSEPEALSFEDWWLLREVVINKPRYYKEILKADFSARGLSKKEQLERWDWASRQFGLKW